MDGYLADLAGICDLAEQHDALVMVDDSHAVGFIGPRGRGTPEHYGVIDRVDVVTGTLGKALGGAQRRVRLAAAARSSRSCASARGPYLFSNSLAPPIVGAALATLDLLESSDELRTRLAENTAWFRGRMVTPVRRAARRAPDRAGDVRRRGRRREFATACSTRASTR